MTPLKVLLVGQNDESLAPLQAALACEELEISGPSAFGPAARTWANIVKPDLVLVVADEGVARTVATIQALTYGIPEWTVVALAEQFERELVRQAMLAGARDVILRTSSPVELREAVITARRADVARRAPAGHNVAHAAGTIVTVVGVKGGIGKTTLAVNLSIFLAQETQRSVALVDLDLPVGDLAMLLNLKPTGGVVSAVSDPAILADPDLLQAQLCEGPAGVHVLTAPINGRDTPIDGAQVGPLLNRLAGLYDFVVVDTAPGFGELTAATLDVATHTLLVTNPEPPTLRRTELALRQLNEWKYPTTKLKVVVNRSSLRTGVRPEEIESLLSEPVAYWLPDEPRALQAASSGLPMAVSQPKSEIGRSLRAIARELGGVREPQTRSAWAFWRSKPPVLAVAN
jgi:pilus assembly protein CpaE